MPFRQHARHAAGRDQPNFEISPAGNGCLDIYRHVFNAEDGLRGEVEAGGDAIEVRHDGSMILDQHRRHRVEFRREGEERELSQRLPPSGDIDLMPVDVAHRVHER